MSEQGQILVLDKKIKTADELAENTVSPVFEKGDTSKGLVSKIYLELEKLGAQLVFTGNYLCWTQGQKSQEIRIFNLLKGQLLTTLKPS